MMDVNTVRTRNAGKEILSLTSEISGLFNQLYSSIDSLNVKGYWQGSSADTFFRELKKDKTNYTKFFNNLNRYGNYLVSYADQTDTNISRVRRNG